jgi:hypothetical protein
MDPSACGDHRNVEQVVVGLRMTSSGYQAKGLVDLPGPLPLMSANADCVPL